MKNWIRYLAIFGLGIFLFQSSGCNDDEPLGFDQAINPIWQYNFGVGLTGGIVPVLTNDLVIVSAQEERNPDLRANYDLIALKKKSGNMEWTWNDHFEVEFQQFDATSNKPIYNGIMAATIGGRNFAINLEDGSTLWKNRNTASTSSSDLSSLGNLLFRTDFGFIEVDGFYRDALLVTDFQSGEWTNVYEVTGGTTDEQNLQVPSFYTDDNGDVILIFTNAINENRGQSNSLVRPFLVSYNYTKKRENYMVRLDENPNKSSAVDWFPIIDGDRVYIAVDDMLVCHNVETGEKIWNRPLNSNLLSVGFVLVDGRLYAKSEGDGILWCIDAITGNVIWQVPSTGTGGPMQYYVDKLYFIGDGLLNIVSMATGETLAQIASPSSFENSNDFFADCKVDHETGLIYVTSFTGVYCYPILN